MRALLCLTLVSCAVAVAACGGDGARSTAPAPDGRVRVPSLKGKTTREATCMLERLGLRWRFRGTRRVYVHPFSPCADEHTGSSMDDIPVTGQTPAVAARVRRGAVVTLDTLCTDAARSGTAGCA